MKTERRGREVDSLKYVVRFFMYLLFFRIKKDEAKKRKSIWRECHQSYDENCFIFHLSKKWKARRRRLTKNYSKKSQWHGSESTNRKSKRRDWSLKTFQRFGDGFCRTQKWKYLFRLQSVRSARPRTGACWPETMTFRRRISSSLECLPIEWTLHCFEAIWNALKLVTWVDDWRMWKSD